MFAILISDENLAEIIQTVPDSDTDVNPIDIFLESKSRWYLVTGYYAEGGAPTDWVVLPQYILDKKYEYNPHVIHNSWDQIVRK